MATPSFNFGGLFPEADDWVARQKDNAVASDVYKGTDLPDVKVKDGSFYSAAEVNQRNQDQVDLNLRYKQALSKGSPFTRADRAGVMGAPTADLESTHALQRQGVAGSIEGAGLGLGSGIAQGAALQDEINSIMETMDMYGAEGIDEIKLGQQLKSNVLNMMRSGIEQDRASSVAIKNWNNSIDAELSGISTSQSALSGAAAGASQGGSVAGLPGAVVGGVLGGIFGSSSAKKKKKRLREAKRNDNALPVDYEDYKAELERRAAGGPPITKGQQSEILEDGMQAIGAKGAQSLRSSTERSLQSQRKIPALLQRNAEMVNRTVTDARRRLDQGTSSAVTKIGKGEQSAALGLQQADLASQRAAEVGVSPTIDKSPSWADTLFTAGSTALGLYGQFKPQDIHANTEYVGPHGPGYPYPNTEPSGPPAPYRGPFA